jgi:hypothetical protein
MIMSTVTSIGCTRMGEFIADREQDALDEAQHQKEQRQSLVHRRAEEIQAKRVTVLSMEDVAIALERLSTYPKCIAMMLEDLAVSNEAFGTTMHELMRNSLFTDSLNQAHDEFKTLDAAKSGGRH